MAHPRILRAGQRFNMAHPLMHSSPGVAGPTLYMLHGAAAVGGIQSGLQTIQYQGGVAVVTPLGTAGKAGSGVPLYPVAAADMGLFGTNTYTFLAYGACSNSGMYSAFDQDNGSTRRFQFRVNAGKLELIVFDGGNNVLTTVTPANALSAADCAAGFLMIGTVQPGRAAIVQGRTLVEASIGTPGALTNAQINVGSRVTGTQSWNTGGLSFVIAWPRAFSNAELMEAAADPTAFFEWDDDFDMLQAPAAAPVGIFASLAWAESDDAMTVGATATDRAAAAWTEDDDVAAIVARETDRASIAWTEANDSTTLSGTVLPNQSGGVAGAIAWTEASDTMTVSGALRDRGAVAWTEQDDVATLVAHADMPPNITLAVRFDVLPRRFGETITHYTN